MIGKGAVGEVFLASFKKETGNQNKHLFAIKRMKKEYVRDKHFVYNIKIEKGIMETSHSQFVARFFAFFKDHQFYYLIMEWAQGGDIYIALSDLSAKGGNFFNQLVRKQSDLFWAVLS